MKTVPIMGIDYEVKQISVGELFKTYEGTSHLDDVKNLFGENLQNFSGLCDALTQTIYINRDIPENKKRKTLMHEIVEALDQECLTELPHISIQTIANALFLSGLFNVEELLQEDETNQDSELID